MFGWLTKLKGGSAPVPAPSPAPSAPQSAAQAAEAKRQEGNALLERGDLDGAAARYREAVAVDDSAVPARVNLAYVLLELQRPEEAEAQLIGAIALDASNADAHYMLGNTMRARGAAADAAAHFAQAIAAQPEFELAYRDGCLACVESAQFDRAEALLLSGLNRFPASADLLFLMGNVHTKAGRREAAVDSYRRALAARGGYVEAHENLAVVLSELGQPEQAAAQLQAVAVLRPNDVDAQCRYGVALQGLGRFDAAVDSFRRAVAIDPASATALSSLGSAYAAQGRRAEAIEQYHVAIAADASHYFAYAGLGVELNEAGRPEEAAQHLREALALNPAAVEPHSNLLFLMSFVAEPLAYLAEARRYGEKVAARVSQHVARQGRARLADTPARIRIGLVSGDLRNHPVAAFLEGVLASLDRSRVEVFAYATAQRDDAVTERLRRLCDGWRSFVGMNDEAAAARVRDDGIHVLIDLAGHTAHNRLSIFALKPAPVQVTWLGYLASSGLAEIDYVLADRVSLPEEHQSHFVEKAWYMPSSLYCFTAPPDAPPVGALPALARGHVTFGSFQRMNKVSDVTLETWSRVLDRVPTARLRLQSKQMGDPVGRAHALERLRRFGVDIERVEMVGPVPDRTAYLACHDHVDIVLDTFPYPGITTTCEALWMGVPTVTLAGNTLLSRQGASLLSCLELGDWVAQDPEDYVSRAAMHASDVAALAMLRSGLRERARLSPLFDTDRFARDFENAMREMIAQAIEPEMAPSR
jgi:predicted O-linked N-acetylglucosamine transferase (SPINDLY family)